MAMSSSASPSSNRGRWAAGSSRASKGAADAHGQMASSSPVPRTSRGPSRSAAAVAPGAGGAPRRAAGGAQGAPPAAAQPVQLGLDPVGPPDGGEHLAVRVLQGGAGGAALVHDHQQRPQRLVAGGGQPS